MASFNGDQPALVVDHVPFFASGSITNGNTATVSFDNLTERVIVTCKTATGGVMLVGVTVAGVGSTQNMSLTAGSTTGVVEMRVKQLVLKANGGDVSYDVTAVLSRLQSSTYPDITTAYGFSGV